ncbi:MAG: signal peptide peptidase SppA [Methanosarcina sp.]|nr:peptidase [Methanosarcina sp. Ant1]
MNDKNINPEGTKPEDISGDDISESSAYNRRENLIPSEGIQDSRGNSSYEGSTSDDPGFGKVANQETHFESPEINKTASENLKMNSNFPPQKKKRSSMSYILILFALLTVILVSAAAILYGFGIGGNLGNSQKVAVIYVQGTMFTGNAPAGLGYATSEEISENIRSAVADKEVKAIVLRINSPGGSPAAAQEIVGEIKKAKAHGIPVVVSMGDSAASAAYYISAPADYIMANPSSTTGSIGVIWVFQNMSAFYKGNGTNYQVIKSGELKDMGSTWRGLTDTEKEYANTVVMEIYEDFVTEVSKGRNMSTSDVKALADGRIYTGAKAKQLGLIDGFGDLYDAIDKAAELGGVTGKPTVVYMNKASLSKLLLGSGSGESSEAQQFTSYFENSPYGKILA